MIRSSLLAFLLVLPVLSATTATTAAAAKPSFATFHLGPAMEVAGDWGTQLKIGQDLGWHIDGTSSGLAIGISLEESFGNCTEGQGASCFSFQAGPKLWYDVQLIDELPIYLAPTGRLAFTHVSVSAGSFTGGFTGAGIQLGLELRAILSERAVLFFRPVTFDVIVGASDSTLSYVYDDNVAMRYDLTFGGGIAF